MNAVEQESNVVSIAADKIDRFDPLPDGHGGAEMVTVNTGDWVKYDDHLRAQLNPSGTPLTKDDDAAYRLLQNILDAVAECEGDDTFAGFQIQEQRNSEGKLLSVRLVPCDRIGGVVAPRVV